MARKRPFPKFSLENTLVIAQAIQDQNAGEPMNRLLLADAVDRKPGSADYRDLLSCSYKYGLTEGTEKAKEISLTTVGEEATLPKAPEERQKALRKAALNPDLYARIFRRYDQHKLPTADFFKNVLEREFNVPREWAEECVKLLHENGRFVGIIQDVGGAPHVMLEAELVETPQREEGAAEDESPGQEPVSPDAEAPEVPPTPVPPPKPKRIFIGHGKNKKPLEQLKKILGEYRVQYRVAEEEPHAGRPISAKVAQTMQECTSGIFIFTADEEVYDKEGSTIPRPSENVIYELGAGSVLYGNKIVVFREEGVDFPSDFKGIGYITFQKDKLDAKAMDLFKELSGFGIIKISAA